MKSSCSLPLSSSSWLHHRFNNDHFRLRRLVPAWPHPTLASSSSFFFFPTPSHTKCSLTQHISSSQMERANLKLLPKQAQVPGASPSSSSLLQHWSPNVVPIGSINRCHRGLASAKMFKQTLPINGNFYLHSEPINCLHQQQSIHHYSTTKMVLSGHEGDVSNVQNIPLTFLHGGHFAMRLDNVKFIFSYWTPIGFMLNMLMEHFNECRHQDCSLSQAEGESAPAANGRLAALFGAEQKIVALSLELDPSAPSSPGKSSDSDTDGEGSPKKKPMDELTVRERLSSKMPLGYAISSVDIDKLVLVVHLQDEQKAAKSQVEFRFYSNDVCQMSILEWNQQNSKNIGHHQGSSAKSFSQNKIGGAASDTKTLAVGDSFAKHELMVSVCFFVQEMTIHSFIPVFRTRTSCNQNSLRSTPGWVQQFDQIVQIRGTSSLQMGWTIFVVCSTWLCGSSNLVRVLVGYHGTRNLDDYIRHDGWVSTINSLLVSWCF